MTLYKKSGTILIYGNNAVLYTKKTEVTLNYEEISDCFGNDSNDIYSGLLDNSYDGECGEGGCGCKLPSVDRNSS